MIYLAMPYASEDPAERQWRTELANRLTAKLLVAGYRVFSPITYGSAFRHFLPFDWKDQNWYEFDLDVLRRSTMLMVLTLPGWQKSRGVGMEVQEARKLGIPITYMDADDAMNLTGFDEYVPPKPKGVAPPSAIDNLPTEEEASVEPLPADLDEWEPEVEPELPRTPVLGVKRRKTTF